MKQTVLLERYKQQLANDYRLTMVQIEQVLSDEVLSREIADLTPYQLDKLLGRVSFAGAVSGFSTHLKQQWRAFFSLQLDWLSLATKLKKPKVKVDFSAPIEISRGVSMNQLLKGLENDTQTRLMGAIRLAHHKGLSNGQLLRLIRGTRKNRFNDGILAVGARQAQTLARTGTAIVANQAKADFAKAHKEIIGIRVNATLDTRTSTICRHLDGHFYRIDEAKFPPYHFNCRSSVELVTADYRTPAKRASMHGAVDGNLTYYEWLAQQDEKTQQMALGKARAKLFASGQISPKRFKQLQLDKNFEPITLDEMRRLEPELFGKVFINDLSVIKKRGVLTRSTRFGEITLSERQLDKKFKHAVDFGIDISKKNAQTKLDFALAIGEHLDDGQTVQFGVYRGDNSQKVYYNKRTGIAVVLHNDTGFVTMFTPKDDENSKQLTNFLKNGVLF